MLGPVQCAKEEFDLEVIQPIQRVAVIALAMAAEDLIRQPVQEGLTGGNRKLSVSVPDAAEPSAALAIDQWLTLGPLHKLNNATARLTRAKWPHQPTNKCS